MYRKVAPKNEQSKYIYVQLKGVVDSFFLPRISVISIKWWDMKNDHRIKVFFYLQILWVRKSERNRNWCYKKKRRKNWHEPQMMKFSINSYFIVYLPKTLIELGPVDFCLLSFINGHTSMSLNVRTYVYEWCGPSKFTYINIYIYVVDTYERKEAKCHFFLSLSCSIVNRPECKQYCWINN